MKEPKKRIVEQIKFNDLKEKEEKENVLVSSQEFQPKEILLKQGKVNLVWSIFHFHCSLIMDIVMVLSKLRLL